MGKWYGQGESEWATTTFRCVGDCSSPSIRLIWHTHTHTYGWLCLASPPPPLPLSTHSAYCTMPLQHRSLSSPHWWAVGVFCAPRFCHCTCTGMIGFLGLMVLMPPHLIFSCSHFRSQMSLLRGYFATVTNKTCFWPFQGDISVMRLFNGHLGWDALILVKKSVIVQVSLLLIEIFT